MRKLLLCLVIGLSAAMLFAVDITSSLNSNGGNWETPEGEEFKVKFAIPNDLTYIRVGFSSSAIDDETTGIFQDKADVTLTENASDDTKFDNTTDPVYVYYQVRTADNVQISLAAESMTQTGSDHKIPFVISFTSGSSDGGTKTIDSAETMATTVGDATEVLSFTPAVDGTAEVKAASVPLTISTTVDNIPVGATGDYAGKIKMFVTMPE